MSFLGPSDRVRNLFRQYVRDNIASEGEPAALGKSASGPVFYTDDDSVVHKNRVWFRKGANKEVVGIARADNMGLPDAPDLPIKVTRRFGIDWVVDYDRNDDEAQPYKVAVSANDTTPDYLINKLVEGANITITETGDGGDETVTIAAASGGGGGGEPQEVLLNALDFRDFNGVPVFVDYNGLLGPVWRFDSSTGLVAIHALTPVPHACTQIRVSSYYAMDNNFSGVNSLEVEVGSMEEGESSGNFGIHDYDLTVATEDVTPPAADDVLGVWTVTMDLNNPLSAGDLLGVVFKRWGTNGDTTNTGELSFGAMRIEFVDADASGSTGSGVHKFHPAEIHAGSNATEGDVTSFTPIISMPDSVTSNISVAFLAEKTSATLDIDIYAVSASGSGDVNLDADAYAGATDGTGTPTDTNGFVSAAAFTQDGFIQKHTITVSFTSQPDLAPGDYCSVVIYRQGGATSPADTLTADLRVLMVVVTENDDG